MGVQVISWISFWTTCISYSFGNLTEYIDILCWLLKKLQWEKWREVWIKKKLLDKIPIGSIKKSLSGESAFHPNQLQRSGRKKNMKKWSLTEEATAFENPPLCIFKQLSFDRFYFLPNLKYAEISIDEKMENLPIRTLI